MFKRVRVCTYTQADTKVQDGLVVEQSGGAAPAARYSFVCVCAFLGGNRKEP